jgi:hypothetical protein
MFNDQCVDASMNLVDVSMNLVDAAVLMEDKNKKTASVPVPSGR